MKPKTTLLTLSALALTAIAGAAALRGPLGWFQAPNAPLPALPVQALGVRDVLLAQPFVLDEPYVHTWRAEQPGVSAGYVLVLEVEEPFTIPRNTAESVLYVGDQTAERINWGTDSGRVVALVPAPQGADGLPVLDLAQALCFYGRPELPERVDAARIAEEQALAVAQGVGPLPAARVAEALATGGEVVHLADRTTLERYAAELVLEYAPAEAELAQGLLAPLVR
ncbi:MAG: hypothetical protein H6828_03795 [Planctomycetes bacterium]|nr:hypothetical protein [Planctomycetota bacterium]